MLPTAMPACFRHTVETLQNVGPRRMGVRIAIEHVESDHFVEVAAARPRGRRRRRSPDNDRSPPSDSARGAAAGRTVRSAPANRSRRTRLPGRARRRSAPGGGSVRPDRQPPVRSADGVRSRSGIDPRSTRSMSASSTWLLAGPSSDQSAVAASRAGARAAVSSISARSPAASESPGRRSWSVRAIRWATSGEVVVAQRVP